MATEQKTTKRKTAPNSISVNIQGRDLRKELLDQLDAENPEFIHSYQSPNLFGQEADEVAWEMETKGQELVKDEKGRPLRHMKDPVVRQSRKEFEERQKFDADQSREQVETVVKPQRSTVKRNAKIPIEGT